MTSSIETLADAVVTHLDSRPTLAGLVALGEPTHAEPAVLALWSAVLDRLVARGVRSVVLETDAVAAVVLDAWVRGGPGRLDDVLATGLTHGFGDRPGMREFVARLRVRNDELPPDERVRVHGFDLSGEITGQPSPRRELSHLHGYLAATLEPVRLPVTADALDDLLGDDGPWGTWEAQLDAAHSVGASPEAVALRTVADDLVAVLHAEAPQLIDATSIAAWRTADLHGRGALALLRYHAVAARTTTGGDRVSWMTGARDEGMARHLLAIRRQERRRGPTLVLAHDAHLQRVRSTWRLGDIPIGWTAAGAIVDAVAEDDYHHVGTVLASSDALGVGAPPDGSLEAVLAEQARDGVVIAPKVDATPRDDLAPEHGYLPLDGAALADADAVVVLDRPDTTPRADPSVVDLATRLLARPGVTHLRAGDGAPESARGDWFFSARADDPMPFATIVVSDYPGHDESSELDRDGVFRLNLGVGRASVPDDLGEDPAALDRFIVHPVYGVQGWIAILNPSRSRLPEIDRLIEIARRRRIRE